MRSHAPRGKRRPSIPVPRALTALAEIATAIATGDSVGAVVPGVLSAVATQLDGTQATLWLRGLDGLRRAWSVAQDHTTAEAVAEQLAHGSERPGDGFVAVRLLAGRQELGALTVRPGRELSGEDAIFVSAVADLLAPALRDAEYAHRLESEVAARTREIEDQRRFTEKIIDSLPVGIYVIDRSYRIQAWNRKREIGLQGVSREEAIGRTIFEILHRQPAEVLRSEFERVFESGEMQQFPIESSAFGEARAYRITKIPMHLDDKDVSHVITIGEDITDWTPRRAALRAGGKARRDRNARRRRHARDQQSAGDDRRVRRDAGARRWTRARSIVQRDDAEKRKESLSLIQQEVTSLQGNHRRAARLQPSQADDEDAWST